MSIAILGGLDTGTGASGVASLSEATTISIFQDRSLNEFDALFVDMDDILDAFAVEEQHLGRRRVVNASDSQRLLTATRRWRERIVDFLQVERVLLIGWTRPPVCEVHTLQDIVEFSAADLLRTMTPRFEPIPQPTMVQSIVGEPFSEFLKRLGAPFEAHCEVKLDPSQPLVIDSFGRACAVYTYAAPSHVLLTALPGGSPARATAVTALSELLSSLGAAPYSSWLPSWARRLRLPGEEQAIAALDRIDRDLQALREERAHRYAYLVSLRGLKSILAGSPERAASAFVEAGRRRGLTLLRTFSDEAAAIFDLTGFEAPVLFVFEDPLWTDDQRRAKCDQILSRYLSESDDRAVVCSVMSSFDPSGSRLAGPLPREPAIEPAVAQARVTAPALVEALSVDDPDLDSALTKLVRDSF